MNDPIVQSENAGEEASRRPLRSAEALVRCKGFRCAAYREKDGTWRSVTDDSVLEVLEVLVKF